MKCCNTTKINFRVKSFPNTKQKISFESCRLKQALQNPYININMNTDMDTNMDMETDMDMDLDLKFAILFSLDNFEDMGM